MSQSSQEAQYVLAIGVKSMAASNGQACPYIWSSTSYWKTATRQVRRFVNRMTNISLRDEMPMCSKLANECQSRDAARYRSSCSDGPLLLLKFFLSADVVRVSQLNSRKFTRIQHNKADCVFARFKFRQIASPEAVLRFQTLRIS